MKILFFILLVITVSISYSQNVKETKIIKVGKEIQGDFNGDGKFETAKLQIVENGIFDEKEWIFSVVFSDLSIPSLLFKCDKDYSVLINEGSLNNISGDKITIYSPPNHGCTFIMTTYSLSKGKWEVMIPTFLFPTFCNYISDEYLENMIFRKEDSVYYYEADNSNDTFNLIKKKVNL